jgi:hypothetical protein
MTRSSPRAKLVTIALFGSVAFHCVDLRAAEQVHPWWRHPQRLLQTNLRDIDATMDVEKYLREVRESGASVVLFNVGGIVANYPTDLPFHYRNPNMKGDLTGTVLKRLRADRIRMIGRFDFSKLNETIAARHPDWLYVSEKGRNVNYNGQVHTCFNGRYQQEKLFEILGEALERYPLDGIFFNMPGYQQSDYSGNYHGICQSDACRKRFKDRCGADLPMKKDGRRPAYKEYQRFCRETADELYTRIQEFVRAKRPELVILNYRTNGSTVVRAESNRPYTSWAHDDTEKAMQRRLAHPDKPLSNAAVHFIRYPHRHAGVSHHLTRRRLLQHMLQGQWVDFYCIGPLQRLEDRLSTDVVRDVFGFHARSERYFRHIRPVADVGLVKARAEEYRGLFDMLSEHHISFDLVALGRSRLSEFPALIVPDAGGLDATTCRKLDAYVEGGGLLLLTGEAPAGLKSAGTLRVRKRHDRVRGTYVRIRNEDKEVLKQPPLDELDLVFLDSGFVEYELAPSARGLLRYIPAAMFGPPEKCYYKEVSDIPCLIGNRRGEGACAVFPWPIGTHYAKQRHPGHAMLVVGAIEGLLGLERAVEVDASPLVEIQHMADEKGRFEWVSLLNISGQKGSSGFFEPIPMKDVVVRVRPRSPVASARLLKAGKELALSRGDDGQVSCSVPELKHYEVVVFHYDD